MSQRYFIHYSYKGTRYHGSQSQPKVATVQDVLEDCLTKFCREPLKITAAGRTDAGVHAKAMWAHVDFKNFRPDANAVYRLNRFLPIDIALHSITKVRPEAHARFDAKSRSYTYKIVQEKAVFHYDFAHLEREPLDVELMNQACELLFEYHDFECFSKVHTDVNTFNCKIMKAIWVQNEDHLLFTIQADRFLRNMVRAIVGTLIRVGKHQTNLKQFRQIIESKNRSLAGESVPAKALILTKVEYPKDLFIND
ncbi:MAG: tRNA pseudouridine(38-40) synthase TruA [Flavobacteriales bacterium]